ncbi:MAG: TadE family protein [Candidatus Sericytochromatia bacterium]
MFIFKRQQEKGQALVELAIVFPLLLVLMLAVGYFGHAVSAQQNLNTAARSAARQMAIDSTSTALRRTLGNYSPDAEIFLELASKDLQSLLRKNQLLVRNQTFIGHDYNQIFDLDGQFERLNEQRFFYALRETVDGTSSAYNSPSPKDRNGKTPENLRSLEMGIGALYYGGTLQYRLDELNPISRVIFQLDSDPTIRIGATALMPAELPLRGGSYGLLSLNPWIGKLVGEDVKTSPDYPDLIGNN